MAGFLGELKRRNVIRVTAVYLASAWVCVQVGDVVAQAFRAPAWLMQVMLTLLAIGFPIVLIVAWLFELTPEGLQLTDRVEPGASIAAQTGRRLDRVLIGVMGVLIAVLLADRLLFAPATRLQRTVDETPAAAAGPAVPSAPAPAAREVLANSVAVLPFTNMSPNADDAYFAQGIHEEVLNQLAKIHSLNVIARTSVLRYADTQMAIPDIARELNVKTVMEGSVRYAGDEVRITAQLIDPATGAHLWSEAYQRKVNDIFAIQADIAMNIANALRAEFSLDEQQAITRPPTSSPAAYSLYLQARASTSTFGGPEFAESLLDRAIALDPDFAAAHGLLAHVYADRFANTGQANSARGEQLADLERRVRELSARALALDPRDYQARLALANINLQSWHWSGFNQQPQADEIRHMIGSDIWKYAWYGNPAQALSIGEQLVALDPGSALSHMGLGVLQAYAGDREASNRSLRYALELNPVNTVSRAWLAFNAAAVGNAEAALAELGVLEQALGADPPVAFLPELAYTYARIGRSDDARRLFAGIEAAGRENDLGAGTWAVGYLAIGDEERALEYLEAAAQKAARHETDAGFLNLMNLRMNFLADPRVESPRFAAVLARIRGD